MSFDPVSLSFELAPDGPLDRLDELKFVWDDNTAVTFRGAIVQDDGQTPWERRIAELEAENRMLSAATRSVEDWEMERGFRVRAETKGKELEAEVEQLRKQLEGV